MTEKQILKKQYQRDLSLTLLLAPITNLALKDLIKEHDLILTLDYFSITSVQHGIVSDLANARRIFNLFSISLWDEPALIRALLDVSDVNTVPYAEIVRPLIIANSLQDDLLLRMNENDDWRIRAENEFAHVNDIFAAQAIQGVLTQNF